MHTQQMAKRVRFVMENTVRMFATMLKANSMCTAAIKSGRKNTSNICLLMVLLDLLPAHAHIL